MEEPAKAEELKSQQSPDIDQILAELGRTVHSEMHKHITYIWNKEKLLGEW